MIDMTEAVCPNDTCNARRDGIVVFRDSQHLTMRFAYSIADILARALDRQIGENPASTQGPVGRVNGRVPPSTP